MQFWAENLNLMVDIRYRAMNCQVQFGNGVNRVKVSGCFSIHRHLLQVKITPVFLWRENLIFLFHISLFFLICKMKVFFNAGSKWMDEIDKHWYFIHVAFKEYRKDRSHLLFHAWSKSDEKKVFHDKGLLIYRRCRGMSLY